MKKDKNRIVKTIKEQVYQILRNDIIEGKYAPGDKISEVDVALKLNVSRSPVHSAVNELIGEGLLENTPNKPVRVKELSIKQILDIYEYRVLVENFSIKKIIETKDPKCFKNLIKFKEKFIELNDYSKIHQYTLTDTQFHQFLVDCSGNDVVAECYNNYSIMITPFRVTSLISHDRFKASVAEHSKMIDYILAGDVKNAIKEDKEHLELAKLEIEKYLKNKDEDKTAK
jgi:DNA-binding GntR family transcriptional regulator